MTIKIKVEVNNEEVAEFELIDNEYVDFEVSKDYEKMVKAFMQDCADVIDRPNEHCLYLH